MTSPLFARIALVKKLFGKYKAAMRKIIKSIKSETKLIQLSTANLIFFNLVKSKNATYLAIFGPMS